MDGRVAPPEGAARVPDGNSEVGRGLIAGFSAYLLWGTMPLYFAMLAPAGAWEILAHRVLWSLVFCGVLLAAFRKPFPSWRRPARENVALALAGLLIAVNWVAYLVAVTSGRITEAALGYFLNPLVSIALGLVFLRERLRRLQILAVGIAGVGALTLALSSDSVPWLAFCLALSFGLYGLVKKSLGNRIGAVEGLTAETAVLAPAAVALLAWVQSTGQATAFISGPLHLALLASTGVVTAIPLLLFAMAARRIPLVAVGLLQFIAPALQFIVGLLNGEPMDAARWAGFSIVWLAVLVLVGDSLISLRRLPTASPPA